MTVISSATQSVRIGDGSPTVIIGERINPTGKLKLSEALTTGNWDLVARMARRQVEAGAQVLDVNVGVPGIDEAATLRQAVQAVCQAVDVPLCIDSANPRALEAALEVYPGKALVNSVTAEAESLERVLPVVKRFGAAVVGLTQDDQGVAMEVERRVAAARRIVERAERLGIDREDLIIDCMALAVSSEPQAGAITLEAIRRVTLDLGCSTVLGASNVSFGLPERRFINGIFLGMAVSAGLGAAIVDPTALEVSRAIVTADMLVGRDEYARRYLAHYRKVVRPLLPGERT